MPQRGLTAATKRAESAARKDLRSVWRRSWGGRLYQRYGTGGAANGANPIAVVVPCHRVAGADGRLTGYTGGLERKRWLLAHEAQHSPLALSLTGVPEPTRTAG
jgi:hypothetical protein